MEVVLTTIVLSVSLAAVGARPCESDGKCCSLHLVGRVDPCSREHLRVPVA